MRHLFLVCLLALLGATCAWGRAPAPKPEPPPAPQPKEYELRIIRVGNTFQGIRFKVSTGESWTMAVDRFEKVPETGPVPAGDYDVTLVTDDTNWMAFRIDRRSGATWQLRNNKWLRIKEPEEKGQ